jgi:FtsP/CotA-like multicopper oxidase with cupredoxin domain
MVVLACAAVGAWAGGVVASGPSAQPASKSPIAKTPVSKPVPVARIAAKHARKPGAAVKRAHVKKQKAAHKARRVLAATTIDLCATTGSLALADGSSVPIWGFALKGLAADCSDVTASLPGPQLDVNQGDTVTLNVTNALAARTISIETPGIDLAAGALEAGSGATVTVSFTASAEGTFLYQSSGDSGRQEAMGLFGALVVHAATGAYGKPFDVEVPKALVLSEIDADFNAAPDTFDMNNWNPKYWLINGQSYQSSTPNIDVPADKTVLVRYANAGIDNNTMTMLGIRETLVGRDGNAVSNPFSVVTNTFPSGETLDALIHIPAGSAGSKFPIYNRNLHLTTGSYGGTNFDQGGMMTFLNVTP